MFVNVAQVAMFDFTSMYAAENACRVKKISRTNDWCCSVNRLDADPGASQPSKKLKSEFCCESRASSISKQSYKRGCSDEGLLLMGLVGGNRHSC